MAKLTYGERKALPGSVFAVDGKKRKYPLTDIAYLAGIIDGEGSIFIERDFALRPNQKSIGYFPRIVISNTDYRLMEWLEENFGGNITKTKRNGNWKDSYTWNISHYKAIKLARLVMPYLKLKGVQSYILNCFDYEVLWTKGGKPEDAKVSDEELERREELYRECKYFNRRETRNGTEITNFAS